MKKVLIFDSGIGGMSILHKLNMTTTGLDVVYLADDLMFPYGNKDSRVLGRHIFELLCTSIEEIQPDLLVIACNTATYNSIDVIRKRYPDLLHVGVEPAVKYLADNSKTRIVSVLSTPLTNGSENIQRLIQKHGHDIALTRKGSDVLAQIAEQYVLDGLCNKEIIKNEIKDLFITDDSGKRTDMIALGCTHYAFLIDIFRELALWPVEWYEPSDSVVNRIQSLLPDRQDFTNKITFQYSSGKNSDALKHAWNVLDQ